MSSSRSSRISSLIKADELRNENFNNRHNSDSKSDIPKSELCTDMLMWVRSVAVDPGNLKRSPETVRKRRVLAARTVLNLASTELPWAKRKFYLLQKKSKITSVLSLEKKSNWQSSTGSGQNPIDSSVSCLINCTDSTKCSTKSLLSDDNLSRKRLRRSLPLECDDSISFSNPSSSQTTAALQDSHKPVHLWKSSNNLRPNHVSASSISQTDDPANFSPSNSCSPSIDTDDSVYSSNQVSAQNQNKHERRKSLRIQNFIGDYIPRLAIPVGPRFQADIPAWTGPIDRKNSSSDDQSNDSRWLGTKIWPTEVNSTELAREDIGKGRSNSCSCSSSGSIKCVKHHISEKRRQLRDDLGIAFFNWKFDEMGEEVANSWTLKDQKSLELLVKKNHSSKNSSFLKPALNQFPRKCTESIISYYFNVFVLRRLSKQTRLASADVDSDDDQASDKVRSSRERNTRYLMGGR